MITPLIVLAFIAAYFGLGYMRVVHNFKYHNSNGWASDNFNATMIFWWLDLISDCFWHLEKHASSKYDPAKITENLEKKDKELKQSITNMEISQGFDLSYPECAPRGYKMQQLEKELDLR